MPQESQIRQFDTANAALTQSSKDVIAQSGLVAAGVGLKIVDGKVTDELCVKAFVWRKLPPTQVPQGRMVPKVMSSPVGTVRTDVEEMLPPTGPPWFSGANWGWSGQWASNVMRQRPFNGGDSISHSSTMLGTISTSVVDPKQPNVSFILSCNHVLAALNRAHVGDVILQPAAGDGGRTPFDTCGYLDRWSPLRFGWEGSNFIDAAIARVNSTDVLSSIDFLGLPAGVRAGNALWPGETVYKVGRTSLLTTGRVVAVNVSGWISYPAALGGNNVPAFFEKQIVTTAMGAFGDSGSLLVDANRYAVGLLFGGSPTHTFYNDIVEVQNELQVVIAQA
jgi:hypothetical protein